jgi:hypothetical protein
VDARRSSRGEQLDEGEWIAFAGNDAVERASLEPNGLPSEEVDGGDHFELAC